MKSFSILFLSLFVFVIMSCSDDSTTSPNDDTTGLQIGQMTAKVDGSSWTSASAMAVKVSDGFYTVSGASLTANSISITVSTSNPGINIFDGNGYYNIIDISNPLNQKVYASSSINYKVTKFADNIIEGTFSFTGQMQNGEGTKSITEGKFRVKVVN